MELSNIAASISAMLMRVEPEFLHLGDQMQTIYTSTHALVEETLAAQETFSGADDSISIRVRRLVNDISASLNDDKLVLGKSIEIAGVVRSHVISLDTAVKGLKTIITRLRMLHVAFLVEDARSGRGTNSLAGFLERLESFIDELSSIYRTLIRDISQTEGKHKAVKTQSRASLFDLVSLSRTAEHTTAEALSLIDSIVEFTDAQSKLITSVMTSVTTSVREIIVALQCHDVVRQRLEHVIEAITLDAVDEELVSVQVAQVESVMASLSAAHSTISKVFAFIGKELTDLMFILHHNNMRMDANDLPECCRALTATIKGIFELRARCITLIKELKTTILDTMVTSDTLRNEIERVLDISDEIQMQALNAVIYSNDLGVNGRGMSVLADEVMRLAGTSRTVVNIVMAELSHLGAYMSSDDIKIIKEENICGSGDEEYSYETLFSYAKTSLMSISEVNRSGEERIRQLTKSIDATISQLSFMVDMTSLLSSLRDSMVEMRALISTDSNNPITQEAANRASMARYTMESERVTHLRRIGKSDGSVCDGDNEIGFGKYSNVELF